MCESNVVVLLGTLIGGLEEMNNELAKLGDDNKSCLIKLAQVRGLWLAPGHQLGRGPYNSEPADKMSGY